MQQIKKIIPFLFLAALLTLLWYELYPKMQNSDKSTMVGEPIPTFNLPLLTDKKHYFSSAALSGQISIINVWASWCTACKMEHQTLMKIKNQYHIPIYGILYRDERQDAVQWLNKNGNPYEMIGMDYDGDTAIDLGIYGTPESFIIDSQGKIIYHQIGIISEEKWEKIIYPLIKEHQNSVAA